LILSGLYRISFDFLREGEGLFYLGTGQYSGIIAVIVGTGWLLKARATHKPASL
jgi:hypothetical protein